MKTILYFLSFSIGVLTLGAAEQTVQVTPQSLDHWGIVGAKKSDLDQSTTLVLPPGAQLARGFGAAKVTLNVEAQTVFSTESTDFPTFEVGP